MFSIRLTMRLLLIRRCKEGDAGIERWGGRPMFALERLEGSR